MLCESAISRCHVQQAARLARVDLGVWPLLNLGDAANQEQKKKKKPFSRPRKGGDGNAIARVVTKKPKEPKQPVVVQSDAPEKKSQKRKKKEKYREKLKAKRLAGSKKKPEDKNKRNLKWCFGCRARGHTLENCPKVQAYVCPKSQSAGGQEDGNVLLCFNCGSKGHSVWMCPEPRDGDGFKFAVCFICKQQGHLSRQCTQNEHGIYPRGGECVYCKGKDHLAKDCPSRAHLPKHGADAGHENRWAKLRAEPGMDDVLGNVEVEEVVERKEKKNRAGSKDAGFGASRRSSGGSSKSRDDSNPFRGGGSEKFKKNRSPVQTRSRGRA